mgnify:CR=1 FL=1
MSAAPNEQSPLDPSLEAEIEAALGQMSLGDVDSGPATQPSQTRGGRPQREGTVRQIRGDDVYVEFDPRTTGVCSITAFDNPPALGSRHTFTIERREVDDGMLILSRKGAISKAKWNDIAEGQVIEAMCTGSNKGGLEMDVSGHKAFMPAGQVDLRHVADLSDFHGKKLPCQVMELDRQRGRMILSRKSVLHEQRKEQAQQLLGTLEKGQTFDGVVTSVQQYGVFVDIGGLDGLVHVSDMSWDRVKSPGDLVKEGDAVRVQVLKVDMGADPPRIGLGMKQLVTDPFSAASSTLSEGAVVTGTVTRLAAFGAFVKIADGIEGLVHISELAHKRVSRPNQVVREGEVVEVKIISIDTDKQRVSLSIKQASGDAGDDASAPLRKDDPTVAKLRAKFGSGIDLKGGLG